MALKDMLPSKQKKILGVPVGRSTTDWGKVANAAVGIGSAAVAAVQAKKRMAPAVEKGKEMVEKGGDAVKKASDVAGKVSSAAGAASDAKTPFGKAIKAASSLGGGGGNGDGDDKNEQGEGHEKALKFYIEEHIDVGVPRGVAYDQWTQFEEFAKIFKGVQGVEQKDERTTQWQAKIGPSRRQWTAEITEQIRPQRIAWRSTGGTDVRGVVTFHELDRELTRVMVQMLYHPRGFVETIGNWFRSARRRTRKDLKLFKNFVEVRREPTGSSRAEIRSEAGRGDEAMEPAEASSDVSRKPSKDERFDQAQDQDQEENGRRDGQDGRSAQSSRSGDDSSRNGNRRSSQSGSSSRSSNGGSNGRTSRSSREGSASSRNGGSRSRTSARSR